MYQQEYNAAIECFNKTLELDSNCLAALKNKAIALYHKRKFREAVDCYDLALCIEPDNGSVLKSKGLALYSLNCFKEAICSFNLALDLVSLEDKKDIMSCISHAKQALQIHMENPQNWSVDQVCNWLVKKVGILSCKELFRDEQIDGEVLLSLTEPDLKELGLSFGNRKKILGALTTLKSNSAKGRNEDECIVCFDAQKDTVLRPCSHFAVCNDCAKVIFESTARCPLCRQTITEIIKVYQ